MGTRFSCATFAALIVSMLVSGQTWGQDTERVGQVTHAVGVRNILLRASGETLVLPEIDAAKEDSAKAEIARSGDRLTTDPNSWLILKLDEVEGQISLENDPFFEGHLHLAGTQDEPVCHLVSGVAKFEKSTVLQSEKKLCKVWTQAATVDTNGTVFLVRARGYVSSIFVIEGEVAVTSTDPRFPEPKRVSGGEWLRARKGEPLPEPRRFRRGDAGAGSSECITAPCTYTESWLIPAPPVTTPFAPLPPPPNPPGRMPR
jgi:hypothetical protein